MLFALLWIIFPAFANWSPNKKSVWFTFWMMLWLYSRQVLGKVEFINSDRNRVTDRQRETGEAKFRQGDNCDCVPLGCPRGWSGFKEAAKLGLCPEQLGVHNDREIMEGNFSLIYGSPESWILNPKWRAMLASTLYQDNLVAIVVDEAHVAYKWWVCIHGYDY